MYTDEQRRSHIFDLQTFLRRIQRDQGYARPIAADGIFGPETAAAVRDFQRHNGLPVTGTADYDTWTAVFRAYRALTAGDVLPGSIARFADRCFGLLTSPERLTAVRSERRAGSRYASLAQTRWELSRARSVYDTHGIDFVDSSSKSVEEMSTLILQSLASRGTTAR